MVVPENNLAINKPRELSGVYITTLESLFTMEPRFTTLNFTLKLYEIIRKHA